MWQVCFQSLFYYALTDSAKWICILTSSVCCRIVLRSICKPDNRVENGCPFLHLGTLCSYCNLIASFLYLCKKLLYFLHDYSICLSVCHVCLSHYQIRNLLLGLYLRRVMKFVTDSPCLIGLALNECLSCSWHTFPVFDISSVFTCVRDYVWMCFSVFCVWRVYLSN